MADHLIVTEIYASIQGESSWTGKPCIFVRLTGCPLRCRWCDTAYGFAGGEKYSIEEILKKIDSYNIPLVELTGGEPLAQEQSFALIDALASKNKTVLIETGGSISIKKVSPAAHIIMDIKCPDSGMHQKNLYENLDDLKASDEIKFVVASRNDFDWAKNLIDKHDLSNRFNVLLSPAWGLTKEQDLVEWMLEKPFACRLNLQIHKYIWSPKKKGV